MQLELSGFNYPPVYICIIHLYISGKITSTCFMKMKLLLTKSWFFYIWIFSKTDSFLMATVFKTSLWIYQMFFNIIRIHAVSVPWLNLRPEGKNQIIHSPHWIFEFHRDKFWYHPCNITQSLVRGSISSGSRKSNVTFPLEY